MKFNLQFFAEEAPEVVDTPVESTEQPSEPTEVDSQTTEEGEETPDYSDFLMAINSKAVYKGEATNYESFDDAITDIQKGKNYDPVYERMTVAEKRLKEIENSRQTQFINKFLKDNGFDSWDSYEDALEIDNLVKEGMSQERAQQFIENKRIAENKAKADAKAKLEADKANLDENNHADAIQWYKDKGYGELTADKISDKTWEKVQNGVPLRYALMEQMFDDVKVNTEQEVISKLQKKKETSMPKLSGSGEEQLKSIWDMTDAEFEKLRNDPKAKAKRFKR